MKIAFWSNARGKCGTTSNLACMSVACTLLKRQKMVLFENHYSINSLEYAFCGSRNRVKNLLREEGYYYDVTGLEYLIKRVQSDMFSDKGISEFTNQFLDQSIYYLPKNPGLNKEYFEFELNQVLSKLLVLLETFADMVWVDTACNNNLSTISILQDADIVVVNLCQSKAVLEHFFENYQSLLPKAVFILGNYQPNSFYNVANVRRKYHISKEIIGVIPYNPHFQDSLSNGSVIEFLTRNFACDGKDENFYFIDQLRRSASILLKTVHQKREVSVRVH
ncbi:hypothetical protein [Anaeromicropila populeti]|uniref:Cellulose biosynthesis protein BcsQ n=1 Tax=Anaeromicropila populeti TaxID=37658 RepID=A0A1I6JD19_9FIRM|nr:hypothetical protein [Anaeromicropila populeti]SFR76925.1 hypothetical protein SAMN05661086_01583 [Anaeromicropila populeti]